MVKLWIRDVDDVDDHDARSKRRNRSNGVTSDLARCWRKAVLRARSHRIAATAALLLCAALLLLSSHQAALRTLGLQLHRSSRSDPHNSAAVLLDGRPVSKPLPQTYPNGAANVHQCDLPSLRYQCDLDSTVGCRAYPQLFPTGDLLTNWSPDEPTAQPKHIFSSICRFNVSIPYELELAHVFHQMEVPFIAYGIPALDLASTRWTDEYLTAKLQPTELYKVHVANNSHFMYYAKSMAQLDEPPTYASHWWSFEQFLQAVASTKRSVDTTADENHTKQHPYYYLMLKALDIQTRAAFVLEDLDFLDPTRIASYGALFIRDAQDALARGMRCRLGMEGIITEGHFDSALNMIAMVRGAKRYILSPPSACACLGIITAGASARHTRLDWSNVTALPASALACPATEVVVAAGDVLYMPSYWYHHIVSLDESIQCNMRSGTILRDDVQTHLTQCGFV